MGRKLTEVARPESGMQNGAGVLQGWEALPAPERWSCLIFFETPRLYSQTGYVGFLMMIKWPMPSRSPATLAGCLGATMGSMCHIGEMRESVNYMVNLS